MIREISYKICCDMLDCKEDANFVLQTKKHFCPKIHFCQSCRNKLYAELASSVIPKSIDAPYSPKRFNKN